MTRIRAILGGAVVTAPLDDPGADHVPLKVIDRELGNVGLAIGVLAITVSLFAPLFIMAASS